MHINKGKTIAQCLHDRIEYSSNPQKTENGTFLSAFACDSHTADAEFLLSKRQYQTLTGREPRNDVIAYQVRQSFRPGEVTPEEANRIGYEFAQRFLKGKHAFLVATHTDKAHIHNHIIWNSTSLDCKRKFRDFFRSGRAVRKLSDLICMEHGLSVIEHPNRCGQSYNKWKGEAAKPSQREQLREAIDGALKKTPANLEELLRLLGEAGYEVKRGKHIALRREGQKRFMRLDSLKSEYTEDYLIAVLAGKAQHTPRKKQLIIKAPEEEQGPQLLIDIQAKLQEGKGIGYAKWAGRFNLKEMAKTLTYLTENKLLDYQALQQKTEDATARYNELSGQIKAAEKRMAEIAVLKTHIINYSKTREVYAAYRKAGYSKKFLSEHESEILLHKAAKKSFDELGVKKLPTVKSLQAEYAALLEGKKAAYAEYRKTREEMRELLIHKANVERVLGQPPEREKEKISQDRNQR